VPAMTDSSRSQLDRAQPPSRDTSGPS
jgi:hypothetical protein